jgi:hypothetical protein
MHMIRWLFYLFYLLIMMHFTCDPWRAYSLSLQDLVGGQFWKNKPSLGFLGD